MKKLAVIIVFATIICLSLGTFTIANATTADDKISDISEVTEMFEGQSVNVSLGSKYVGNARIEYGQKVTFYYKNSDAGVQHRMSFGIGYYGFYLYYNSPDETTSVFSCDMSNFSRQTKFTTIKRSIYLDFNRIELCLNEKDENNVTLQMTYSDGDERAAISCDFAKNAADDGLFRYGDMNFNGNVVKSTLAEPRFGDGFTFSGENVAGVNVYGGCDLAVVSSAAALKKGVPAGFSGQSVLIMSATLSSYDMIFDFSPLDYKRDRITGISFRVYVEKTERDSASYPEIRIPADSTGSSWIKQFTIGSQKTGNWAEFSLTASEIDALCKGGKLGRFVLGVRNNAIAKTYIDYVKIDLLPLDEEAPVITSAFTSFKTTVGTYPAYDFVTATDNSGVVRVDYEWSAGALDYNGRMNVGEHTCTFIATDPSGNTASLAVKYIVEDESAPEVYSITFKAEGHEDVILHYTVDTVDYLVLPKIDERKYYNGSWGDFTPEFNDTQVVEVQYTPIVYTVSYLVDGKTVATVKYSIEDFDFSVPAVPEKKGYEGKWEDHEYKFENLTVNAVYTVKECTITFVAEGKVVSIVRYSIENLDFSVPAVPEKEGYEGKWEDYECDFTDLTVNAIYVKPNENPDQSGDSKTGEIDSCSSSFSTFAGLSVLLAASFVAFIVKRKG